MKDLNNLKSFDSIKIYLASNDEMYAWSFGEVVKPETINYRTFRPEREGLFDERIFGPVKNYECYCGKYKGIRYKGVICDKCGVEVTHSRVRRERMGHITLATPVAHVWFFRGIPSKMALLLDITPRNVESIIYFSSFIVTKIDGNKKAHAISKVEEDIQAIKDSIIKEQDVEILKLEKEASSYSRHKDELKAQEEIIKIRQRIQILRDVYAKKIDEAEIELILVQKRIEGIYLYSVMSDNEYLKMADYVDSFCQVEIGAEALEKILKEMDLTVLASDLKEEFETSKGQKASKISRRLKVVEQFRRAKINPDRMILRVVPVIPPDLRPMVLLEGGRFATSDLNDLYRRLINRNNRLKRLLNLGAPEIIIRNEKRMLQEAVDALFDSSKQRQRQRTSRGRKELRSLTDMLKGKQGIFRLNLLGKRVDYSGRGVIINGPKLKLNECGLPREMALELFKPFVLREILSRGYAPNVKSAKYILESRGGEVWDILDDLVKDHPVLLNRAPTLWRLGIQAFYPKLIDGNAIRLHLCVCTGFNADFDGDQMAVHLPLSEMAIKEAKDLLLSTNNLLSPSDGTPISVPTKIILFGIFHLTSVDVKLPEYLSVFANTEELLFAHDFGKIKLRQKVKVQINGDVIDTTVGRVIFNQKVPSSLSGFVNEELTKSKVTGLLIRSFEKENHERVAQFIDDLKDFGLKYGTASGHSISLYDMQIPKNREELIEQGRLSDLEIKKNYSRGLITSTEAQRLIEDLWNQITTNVDNSVWNNMPDDNPVKVLLKSGATRASRDQVNQVAGIRGLIADPTGHIVQLPILGNYKLGLSGLEYFVSARGARKGLVDKGLKTADAGYLTRRLVDVSQDVIIREEDCGTMRGREMKVGESTMLQTFSARVIGRYLAHDAKSGKKIIAKRGVLLTKDVVEKIENAKIEKIVLRSPLDCETRRGMCATCYGLDMTTKELVRIGTSVGVGAAQSIGEPGTQLTMRTFHTGGIAKKDITQGLPRVEELVEARAPKYLSIMSETTGIVKIVQAGDERKIIVMATDKTEDMQVMEYLIDPVAEILVEDSKVVAKGEKLTSGHLDLTDLLRTVGINETKKYIIDEIQKVYSSQGVSLNDKHIEVIVRQMFNNVRIDERGDTEFLPGELVTRAKFGDENEKIIAQGGTPATAKVTLLGITKSALYTDSFLSAASFIQTGNVLTDAAASGRVDNLLGLKENVILGRLIPTGERAILN